MVASTEEMLLALQEQNLVYNGTFLYYSNAEMSGSRPIYNHPDGWIYEDLGTNGEISFDTQKLACLIQKSSNDDIMSFTQGINEFPRWQNTLIGNTVQAKIQIENPSTSGGSFKLTFFMDDGVGPSEVTQSFKPGESDEMTLHLEIDPAATTLVLGIRCSTPNAVILISKVCANIGPVALYNLPCIVKGVIGERKQYIATQNPPAEELSLCHGPTEIPQELSRLRSVINNKFGVSPNTRNPYLIDMRGYFSRAWDNGASVDTDANNRTACNDGGVTGDRVGTLEGDAFKEHDHGLLFSINKTINIGGEESTTVINLAETSSTEKSSMAMETRPVNIAELYTIKWA